MNEELERITIFNSYARSIDQLARGDLQLAQELSYWIIQFGIKGIEPPADSNPFMLSVFEQIKEPLMNGRKKGMNAKKKSKTDEEEIKEETENEEKKSNENQNEIKMKSKGNQTVTKDKIKKKKEKKEIITLSSNEDNGASTGEFGDSEINECLEIIKSFNGGIIDGTQKQNRIRGKNLIGKLKKSEFVQNQNYTRQNTLTAVLNVVAQNKFYVSKITSPELIYKNLAILFQVCRQEGMNQTPQIEVL